MKSESFSDRKLLSREELGGGMENRKHPRFGCDEGAAMECWGYELLGGRSKKIKVSGKIHNVSKGGLAIQVPDTKALPKAQQEARLTFRAGYRQLTLLGQVAWAEAGADSTSVGVRFRLELLDQSTRDQLYHWVTTLETQASG
jgi:hypothetical protein